MKSKLLLATALWCLAGSALAGETILRGPAPEWLPPLTPHLSNRPDTANQHVRYELLENHTRGFGTHTETYIRLRAKVLSPLGLQQASQLLLLWEPSLQTPTIHSANIIRAGESLDILEKADFTVLRREAALEQSLQINGILTGVLVVPDVRVGDTVDFAYSLRSQFDLFGNPLYAAPSYASPFPVDQVVTTIGWPSSLRVQTRAGRYAAVPPITEANGFKHISMRSVDVEAEALPDDITARFAIEHSWQLSSIAQWSNIADYIRPAYQQAAILPEADDLATHIARIKAEHTTPEARAMAALRLVQDDVRYMALTLGEAGWLPASASEVWASRQGDCKGKTVLLIAILKELGINAVPVLVSSNNLPLDQYLPYVGAFDHVIVKASINGETYLMDGARIGDRSLRPDTPLVHEYVLPLVEQARLEHIPARLPPRPGSSTQIEIDFTQGVYSPAKLTYTQIIRGDEATNLHQVTGTGSTSEINRWFDQFWDSATKPLGEISELKHEWEYKEDTHEFVNIATARIAFDWSAGPVNIPRAYVAFNATEARSETRFKDADYAIGFPGSASIRTTLILPETRNPLLLSVEPYDFEAGGVRYSRTVKRNENRLETERNIVVLRPYMTAAEQAAEQAVFDRFKDQNATMRLDRSIPMTAADRTALTEQQSSDPDAALRRGYMLLAAGDYALSVEQFNAAIEGTGAPNANALANRAIAYLELGEIDKARADIDASEAADMDETVLYHAKGRLAEIEGDHLEAVLAYSTAIRLWPENTFALQQRSEAYDRMGQYARALADLERLLTLNANDYWVQQNIIVQLMKLGRVQDAHTKTTQIAKDIGHEQAGFALFMSATQQALAGLSDDPAKAEALVTQALAVETDVPGLLLDRAYLRARLGNTHGHNQDLARFKELTRIDINNPLQTCTSRSLRSHSMLSSLAQCDEALEKDSSNAVLHAQRGYFLGKLLRYEEAAQAYRQALELAPEDYQAQYGLGQMLAYAGQVSEGERLKQEALDADASASKDYPNRTTEAP